MFDDLFEIFDRGRSHRSANPGQQRGLRGFLARLMGDDEPDERRSRPRRHDEYDDEEDVDRDRSSRRRRRGDFEWDD